MIKKQRLANFIAYCLNPNHFHFALEEIREGGISELMKRISGGYTWSFNSKYKRSGSLLQGVFKSMHVKDNDYLLHLSAYINLNDKVHQLGGETAKLVRSSWDEYTDRTDHEICKKKMVLDQFRSKSEYGKFALATLPDMINIKREAKELKDLFHE